MLQLQAYNYLYYTIQIKVSGIVSFKSIKFLILMRINRMKCTLSSKFSRGHFPKQNKEVTD